MVVHAILPWSDTWYCQCQGTYLDMYFVERSKQGSMPTTVVLCWLWNSWAYPTKPAV